jgi:hypothetical protein
MTAGGSLDATRGIPGDYEVGYGRPPCEHQFKKGEPSHNPKGRPRGTSGPAPDLVAALWQPVTIKMNGKERKVPYPEALIQVTKDKALKGDQRATQTLINLMRALDSLKRRSGHPPSIFTLPGQEIRSTSDRHHDTLPEHPDQMPSMVAANAEAAQSLNRARKSSR